MSVIVSFGRSLFPLETDVATPFSTRNPLSSHTHSLSLCTSPILPTILSAPYTIWMTGRQRSVSTYRDTESIYADIYIFQIVLLRFSGKSYTIIGLSPETKIYARLCARGLYVCSVFVCELKCVVFVRIYILYITCSR